MSDTAIKTEFVKRILSDEKDRFLRNQTRVIQSRLESHSGKLLSGRSIGISSDDSMDGKFTLTHPVYERFLDMKRVVKRKRSAGYAKRRRAAQIHNRFIFGHYYSIAERLMVDLTDEMAESIKEDLGLTNLNIEL